jgi:choline/glycine/proline betaine transport protein
VYAYGGRPEWLGGWTVFYWAWWIGWAPFVGLFIARISRGRTIREFVFGVLLIPLGFTLAWLSIFGNSALDQVLHHGQQQLAQLAVDDPPTVLYALLDGYPWSRTVIAVTVLVSFIFFVTSADSGAVVLSTLSSHGGAPEDDGPRWLRVLGHGDRGADRAAAGRQHRCAEIGGGAGVAAVLGDPVADDVGPDPRLQ